MTIAFYITITNYFVIKSVHATDTYTYLHVTTVNYRQYDARARLLHQSSAEKRGEGLQSYLQTNDCIIQLNES